MEATEHHTRNRPPTINSFLLIDIAFNKRFYRVIQSYLNCNSFLIKITSISELTTHSSQFEDNYRHIYYIFLIPRNSWILPTYDYVTMY